MLNYLALLLAALCLFLVVPLTAYAFVLSARDIFATKFKNALACIGTCALWLALYCAAAWRVLPCDGNSCVFPFQPVDSFGYAACLAIGLALLKSFVKQARKQRPANS
jgi:hypothetical protein